MIAWWWLIIAAWIGAGLAVLACSLSMAAHIEALPCYLLGRCTDCGQAVFEGDECIVRHVDCPNCYQYIWDQNQDYLIEKNSH